MALTKLSLESDITKIPGIGATLSAKLKTLEINTIRDLLYVFPFRYEDLSNEKKIAEVQIGDTVSLTASIWQIGKFKTARGKTIIKAVINDGSNSLDVVWFNQDYLLKVLRQNQIFNFSGKIGFFGYKKVLLNPSFETLKHGQNLIHTKGIVPIYLQKAGLTKKFLRSKIYEILFKFGLEFPDPIPQKILNQENLFSLKKALEKIHFPKNESEAIAARKRFAFEKLLFLHLRNLLKKPAKAQIFAPVLKLNKREFDSYQKSLPFTLTSSQVKAVEEILADLQKGLPMNRLLQGEVGSGKTVVASFAINACLSSGFKAVFMAPTEILAKQHFDTLKKFFNGKYPIGLATSATKKGLKDFQLLVGTHAVLEKNIEIENLGLVIVDEQQRFGVLQRLRLRRKGESPHFLTMSATPIPRTLALTFFGDLEISRLSELPNNRKKIKTYLVPTNKRNDAYNFLRQQIAKGNQVYLICPFIEPSESLETVKSAKTEFEFLKTKVFSKEKLGLLHGRLNSKEKDQILENFRSKKIDLLVSTPVVEVGIDVPNATVIVIEAAERFGLSTLHQLRGRVGRGGKQSYCLIFSEKDDPKTLARLKVLERSSDGFEIAEEDLRLRGAGDIYGSLQHGNFFFKLTEAINLELIQETKEAAEKIIRQNFFNSQLKKLLKSKENFINASFLD